MVDEASKVDSAAVESTVASNQSAPVSNEVDNSQSKSETVPVEQKVEKTDRVFTRDEVAKITNAETKKAVEKARREFEAAQLLNAQKAQNSQIPNQQYSTPAQTDVEQNVGLSSDQLRGLVRQEAAVLAQEQAQEMMFEQAINSFHSKMEDAQTRYSDYKDSIKKLELYNMPEQSLKSLIALLNVADNGADVLYDISQNPRKLIDLEVLAARNPKLAIEEVHKLSRSIKANQAATKTPVPNAPLSQITPSTTGTDNGTMTLRDMKKQPWARG